MLRGSQHMTIPVSRARQIVADLQVPTAVNLFAQAHAKHVLREVGELPSNFPAFDPDLDDKTTFAAYGLMAAACSIVEGGDRSAGIGALERAASLLQYAHGPTARDSRGSAFHVLVAAMAFYAAGQYSRAFVAIRAVEQYTPAARVVGAFLRKDSARLIGELNEILLQPQPLLDENSDIDEWGITLAICRAIAVAHEFMLTGVQNGLGLADAQLRDAVAITIAGSHPAWWWVVRLLRLMLNDLGSSSPWQVLPPYFGPDLFDGMSRYVRLLAFGRQPVTELWISQRSALPRALDMTNRGAIINLRTSAGKTRVADLAILRTLLANPAARVFYLAPFRSLALEVEQTLNATFSWLGHTVSHLYGGSRISSVDTELAAESTITIATPEKARALVRATPELFRDVKLVIVDEGHMIGGSERDVRNEIFIDHLRYLVRAMDARILLLSAVLPNAEELATWVTGDVDAVATSPWKPSAERFGLLRWNGSRVRIDWQGDVPSYNLSFVEAQPLGFGRRVKPFPSDKSEAVAASAVRLSTIGPVMIFTGRAVSVPTLAKAVLLALGEHPPAHPWPDHEWKVFEAVCQEELDPDAIEIRAARAGVVCHSSRLTPQVRLALEHLLRSHPPKIIIATTTLAQGVNVGISSVIVASPYIDQRPINRRDFWNICGRAGRAYIDGEGKILYAIDDTRKPWQIRADEALARTYFDAQATDPVKSGLLFVIRWLRRIAHQADVSFELLIQLAADNDFSQLGGRAPDCEEICDLLDDELLALHADVTVNPDASSPEIWVERVFRESLAVLQARSTSSEVGGEDVLSFLKARARWVLHRVPQDERKAVVASGLPLRVAYRAYEDLDIFRTIADSCDSEQPSLAEAVNAVRAIEDWARGNASSVAPDMPAASRLDALRAGWLSGIGLHVLKLVDSEAPSIARDLYGYQLPWIIHSSSQQLRVVGESDRADKLARLALLVELGVPNELAARIFIAGVRSRAAATELAALPAEFELSIAEINRRLRSPDFADRLRTSVSDSTVRWLELIAEDAFRRRPLPVPDFAPFALEDCEGIDLLHARRLHDGVFLCSTDGRVRHAVTSTNETPFADIANDPRVAFTRLGDIWRLTPRDPRLEHD
jgi:hypothetical protein